MMMIIGVQMQSELTWKQRNGNSMNKPRRAAHNDTHSSCLNIPYALIGLQFPRTDVV